VKSKDIHSLIIEGSSGLGKSTITFQTLVRELNLKPNKDFIIINGHLSSLELYHLLWKYQSAVVVIDDISDLLESPQGKSVLLSATWNTTPVRTIKWLTTSSKLEAPKEFEFKGKIIFLVNRIPSELEALKSRCYHYRLNFNWKDKLKIAYEIAKATNIPFEMIDWIKTKKLYDFDFRLPVKLLNLGDNWKDLAEKTIENDEKLELLAELINSNKKVNEQISEWKQKTGYSRASFFNYRNDYFPDYKKGD